MKRPAVALMLTLFMLLAMSAALSITMELFQKSFKTYNANTFRVQSAVLMVDVVSIMKSLVKDIGDSPEAFDVLVQSSAELPFSFGNVDMIVRIHPKNSKFNINHYTREKHYEKIYSYLLEYEILRPEYILDMIEDSLDEDSDEMQYGSERVLYDPFFIQGKIVDEVQFNKLIDAYVKETKDISIYKIPFHDWISFDDTFVDEKYMTVELQRVLETAGGRSSELSDFTDMGENSSELSCEVFLRQEDAQSIANFDFSFKTKEVTNFRAIL